MVNYCNQCGKILKKDPTFCPFCNYQLEQELTEKVQSKRELKKKSDHKNKSHGGTIQILKEIKSEKETKRSSKYILSSSQRKIFLQKVLPFLLVGNIIWLMSEVMFTLIFTGIQFTTGFFEFYFLIIALNIILFVSINYISLKNTYTFGLIIFLIFTFTAGIITVPIVMLNSNLSKQVHMFVFSALESTIIVGLMGLSLRDKYFAKGYIWAHVILFIFYIILAEIIFLLVFNIKNFILTIPISLAGICAVTLVLLFFGVRATKKLEKSPPIFIGYKIVSVFVFILFGSIFVAIVILIIVVIAIILSDSDIHLPIGIPSFNWFWGPTPSSGRDYKRTKKKR